MDRKPSKDEIAQAFLTLTTGERRNLALLGMTAILEDTQSLKGFYEFLSGWKKMKHSVLVCYKKYGCPSRRCKVEIRSKRH